MTTRETRGDWDDKIAQILDDPVDAERTPKELAMVEAELKQPVSLNRLSSDPSYRKRRDTLKLILDYNKSETTNNASSPPNKSKRSTEKDEGQEKLIAADDILLELGKAVEPEDTPSPLDSKPEPTNKSEKRMLWLARAMVAVQEHPDWPDCKIAEQVNIHRSTLSRSKVYKAAAAMARSSKGETRRGYLTVDSESGQRDVEAYSDTPDRGDWRE